MLQSLNTCDICDLYTLTPLLGSNVAVIAHICFRDDAAQGGELSLSDKA